MAVVTVGSCHMSSNRGLWIRQQKEKGLGNLAARAGTTINARYMISRVPGWCRSYESGLLVLRIHFVTYVAMQRGPSMTLLVPRNPRKSPILHSQLEGSEVCSVLSRHAWRIRGL